MEIGKEIINGVCRITLNRPSVFNSFNKTMALQLQDVLDDCAVNPEIRAVLITGEGKAFCAGQDLAEAIDPEGPALRSIVKDHYNPIILKIRELEKPVIAAVNGVAAGAGALVGAASTAGRASPPALAKRLLSPPKLPSQNHRLQSRPRWVGGLVEVLLRPLPPQPSTGLAALTLAPRWTRAWASGSAAPPASTRCRPPCPRP
jgi:hypothetical protein